MVDVFHFGAVDIHGNEQSLSPYRGRWLLIVNVASKCGFTPQYEGLEALYRKYKDRGLTVLGFPCDQFGHQEPGDEEEIKSFCSTRFDVSFPMFAKIKVNGADAHPLYKFLKRQKKGLFGSQTIKWNFTKFLVDPEGHVAARYGPAETPAAIGKDLKKLLRG